MRSVSLSVVIDTGHNVMRSYNDHTQTLSSCLELYIDIGLNAKRYYNDPT